MNRHSARTWAEPDTRRAAVVGQWDCYCVACGRYVQTEDAAIAPASVACQNCQRLADLARGTITAQRAGGAHQPGG